MDVFDANKESESVKLSKVIRLHELDYIYESKSFIIFMIEVEGFVLDSLTLPTYKFGFIQLVY